MEEDRAGHGGPSRGGDLVETLVALSQGDLLSLREPGVPLPPGRGTRTLRVACGLC